MKIQLITILLLFLFTNAARSQNTIPDSLSHLISQAKQDSSKVLLLVKLSRGYQYSQPELSLQLAEMGLTIARKIKFKRGEARCLTAIGTEIGLTGNYPKSLELLLEALKIAEEINDKPGIANCYVYLGNSYADQGEFRKSIVYYRNAESVIESLDNEMLLMVTLINLGDSYEKLNSLDSARTNTEQGYKLCVRLNAEEQKGACLNNLGNIYSKMNKADTAMLFYRKSLPFSESTDNFETMCETNLGMAKLFRKAKQQDSALTYARLSMSIAQRTGFTKRILEASNFLSNFYEQINNVDSAYAYQKVSISARDSLFSQEKEKLLRNISFAEQTRQAEIANEALEAKEARRKNIQMAGIGVFIPTFLGIILYFSRRKKKSKTFQFMGLLGLLLLFEFIALFIHPYIEEWTHHTPVLMLLILVAIASILVPLHHKLEHWIKEKLAQNHHVKLTI